MKMHDQDFQGDVVIARLPEGVRITSNEVIPARKGTVILAAGEVTGHHHAIRFGMNGVAMFRDDGLARDMPAAIESGTAILYRDPRALAALKSCGFLAGDFNDSLCLGFLRIEGDAPAVTHEEHDAIKLPPGEYYVGGKREWNAGEERRVAD